MNEIPQSWREHPFDTEAAFGHTGAGQVDEGIVKVWDRPPAPSAIDPANRRDKTETPALSRPRQHELDAITAETAAVTYALESAELALEWMGSRASEDRKRIVVGLREWKEELDRRRKVFDRQIEVG